MTREDYIKWGDTEVFKEWVNGADVEVNLDRSGWRPAAHPSWDCTLEYRIKPTKFKQGDVIISKNLKGRPIIMILADQSKICFSGSGINDEGMFSEMMSVLSIEDDWRLATDEDIIICFRG